jgi:hypothetical protein
MNHPTREQLREALRVHGELCDLFDGYMLAEGYQADVMREKLTQAFINGGEQAMHTFAVFTEALVEGPTDEQVEAAKSAIGRTFIEQLGWGESKPFAALEVYAIAEIAARAALEAALRIEEPEPELG